MHLVIGNKNYSSWSLRAWLTLRNCGVAFDEQVVPLDRPGYREMLSALSPSARVPVLIDEGLVVWESMAICEYLSEKYPDAGLWPAELRARTHARAISQEMHAGFGALRDRLPMDVRSSGLSVTYDDELQADITRILAIWSSTRAEFGASGRFLYGSFCIADAMYAPVVSRFHTYGVPLTPECADYARAIWECPPMRDWRAAARDEPWTIDLS